MLCTASQVAVGWFGIAEVRNHPTHGHFHGYAQVIDIQNEDIIVEFFGGVTATVQAFTPMGDNRGSWIDFL